MLKNVASNEGIDSISQNAYILFGNLSLYEIHTKEKHKKQRQQ